MNTHLTTKPQKRSIHKGLLIGLTAVIILVGLVLINFTKAKLISRYLFEYDHFNAGDNVYIKPVFFKSDSSRFVLVRVIRPQTEHDIDSLNLSSEEKAELKLKINPTLKPYAIVTQDWAITSKKHPLIGNYIKHEMLDITDEATHQKVPFIFYAIHPTEQALKISSYDLKYPDLPAGYTWADNTYYIGPQFLTNSPK